MSIAYEHIREIVTRHKGWLAVTLALAGVSLAIGYFLSDPLIGLAIGLALAPVSIWARGKVTTRERTITRSGPR